MPTKKNTKGSSAKRKQTIHNAARTIMHTAMKQNSENKLTAAGTKESIASIGNRYAAWASDRKDRMATDNRLIKDAAEIRKNRIASNKKTTGGSGSSRSDAVKKAWITRKKNKG